MKNRVSLQEWVKNQGSIRAASDKLGIPCSTLSAYCRFERFPHPHAMQVMISVIGSEVDFGPLAAGWLQHQKASTPRRRRLRSGLPVKNAERLRALYSELDLNSGGIESAAPKILPRWQTTKVTVGEVRDAVAALKVANRNPSDLSQIHEVIGANRTAQLRSLNK